MFLKRKPLLTVLFILFLLLGAGFLSYSFFLPRYIERKILPDLGRKLSGSLSGRVYSIGLFSADFGDIVLGDKQDQAVNIGVIHAEYSLSSLRARKLDNVKINGLRLNLKLSNGTFIIPGLDLEKSGSEQPVRQNSKQSDNISLPIIPDSFQIQNGLVSFLYGEEHFIIPFDLELVRQIQGNQTVPPTFYFSLQMLPQGEKISIEGIIDLAANKANFSFAAPSLDLNRFLVLSGLTPGAISTGKGSITAKTRVSLMPFQVEEALVTADLEPIFFGQIPIILGSATKTQDREAAISLDLKNELEQWLLNVRVTVGEPFGAFLELNSSAAMEEDNLHSSGRFSVKPLVQSDPEQQFRYAQIFKKIPELEGNFVIDFMKNGAWKATIESPVANSQDFQAKELDVLFLDTSLKAGMPILSLKGMGDARKDELDLSVSIPGLRAQNNDAEIKIPMVNLHALYIQDKDPDHEDPATPGQGAFKITLNDTQFNKNNLSGRADITLQGNMEHQPAGETGSLQTSGTVTVSKAEFIDADNSITVKNIAGKIPWQWPASDQEAAGELEAAKMSFGRYDLGSFKADLRLRQMIYSLTGSFTSSLLAGITAGVSGKAEISDSGPLGEIAVHIDPTPLASIHLGKFQSSLKNAYFSGLVGLESSLRFNKAGIQGRAQSRIEQGRFELPEKKYVVEGIDISFVLPSLPGLRSSPAQKIFFKKASAGDIVIENGRIIWQLESPDTILIEESMFRWAGGRIFTNAVRLSPDMKELSITLFCDRLKLSDLLEQFGVSNAQGEGTVSGRIPLTIGMNRVHFEDGFLYSSPGQGGSVRVAAFDTLAAGIPKNTPQFAQVDFAAEAMKNFSYNWVKLLFNTEGEELVMQMQMDGKPVQSLPFSYDSRTGMLQRIENGAQGINQPIRLDVNFRLPLNRFLGYSGRIQDIMDKIK